MKNSYIAGEPLELLIRGLEAIEYEKTKQGTITFHAEMDRKAGAAWARAIERYAADFIRVDRHDRPEQRQADAFVKLVVEIADAATGGPSG